MDPVPGATIVQGDFTDDDMPGRLRDLLGGPADLVLSDMAPNLSGIAVADAARVEHIIDLGCI